MLPLSQNIPGDVRSSTVAVAAALPRLLIEFHHNWARGVVDRKETKQNINKTELLKSQFVSVFIIKQEYCAKGVTL